MNKLPFELSKDHKRYMKAKWKSSGIIFVGLFEEIYDIVIHCDKCDNCGGKFKNSKDRHLDHNHLITDDFNIRNILCQNCHNNRRQQKWNTNTGEQYIMKCNRPAYTQKFCYLVHIRRYGKRFERKRKTLEEAIVVRDEFIKNNPEYFI